MSEKPSPPGGHRSNRLTFGVATILAVMITTTLVGGASVAGGDSAMPVRAPAPVFDQPSSTAASQTAVLSGGCFWGVQGVFQHVKGVTQVLSGYAGGLKATADYGMVSTGTTGHAESVKILFDPRQISYGEILRIYFSVATDPTQLNHQFPDEGTQYRGNIFYMDDSQKVVAQRYVAQLNAAKIFKQPIVTRIDPFKGFFVAERYHQDFLLLHPNQPYIATYDMPKVAALKTLFPARYRVEPVRTL